MRMVLLTLGSWDTPSKKHTEGVGTVPPTLIQSFIEITQSLSPFHVVGSIGQSPKLLRVATVTHCQH